MALAVHGGEAINTVATSQEEVESPRILTGASGLSTLESLQKTLDLDGRRANANIQLNKSMSEWICRKTPGNPSYRPSENLPQPNEMLSQSCRTCKVNGVRNASTFCVVSLEEAFRAHSAAFELNGEGKICVEELIQILERCRLLDEFFTANKIRNYFSTWAFGCNHVHGVTDPLTHDGLGFQEFEDILRWGADIKGVDFESCAQRVVRLSRKLCDKSSSVQRRLEVVFDAFCKRKPDVMSAFEFGLLCQKMGVYQEDKFTMGDVYSLFYQISGVVHGDGVSFPAFIEVLRLVGERLEIGEALFDHIAEGVKSLDADQEMIARVKMRLMKAAEIVGGADWRAFFHSCDPDQSGTIEWDEFLAMCRDRLHLNDREPHLRILFDKLDLEGSGELPIDVLIEFIESDTMIWN